MIRLEISYPPSANRLWRKARGRVYRAPNYVEWLEREGWNIINQRQGGIVGPYKLAMSVVRPDKRKRDLDNLIKPVSDLLKSVGVIGDDSDAQRIELEWVKEGPAVTVRVEKA